MQRAVAEVLNAVYEQDFLGFSVNREPANRESELTKSAVVYIVGVYIIGGLAWYERRYT